MADAAVGPPAQTDAALGAAGDEGDEGEEPSDGAAPPPELQAALLQLGVALEPLLGGANWVSRPLTSTASVLTAYRDAAADAAETHSELLPAEGETAM